MMTHPSSLTISSTFVSVSVVVIGCSLTEISLSMVLLFFFFFVKEKKKKNTKKWNMTFL